MSAKKAIKDLPSGVSVLKTVNGAGTEYWRVRLGKKFTGGEVLRRDFSTLASAREWINGPEVSTVKALPATGGILELVEGAKASARSLTPKQIDSASDAFRRLEPFKLTLEEAVTIALRHARPKAGAISFADAVPLFLKAPRKRPLATSTANAYRNSVNMLAADLPKKKTHEVSKADLEEFLQDDEWEPATQAHHLRNLRVFFAWAVKIGHAGLNPCGDIPEPADDKEPGALTADQAAGLLAAAEQDMEMLPGIVLGLFGGLRTSEIRRLTWGEVGDTQIEIKPAKTKTRRRRLVTINPTLQAWLSICRKATGPVAPLDWREGFEGVISRAGYQVGEVKEGEEAKPSWPRNAMRHSYGSFYFAESKNETLTSAEMGNSPAMVFAHYRRVFPAKEVEAFWALRPSPKEAQSENK